MSQFVPRPGVRVTVCPLAGCASPGTTHRPISHLCFWMGWCLVCGPNLLLSLWPPHDGDVNMSLAGSFLPEILQKEKRGAVLPLPWWSARGHRRGHHSPRQIQPALGSRKPKPVFMLFNGFLCNKRVSI